MSIDRVSALLFVGGHSIAGSVAHSGTRILDVLNDANTEFLAVLGGTIYRGVEGQPIGSFESATVPKSAIDCVVLTDEGHEAPLRRKYALIEKKSQGVFVLLPDYEIRGTAMVTRTFDPVQLLGGGASTFFPLVEANVSSIAGAGSALAAKVAFVNKHKVALLQAEK